MAQPLAVEDVRKDTLPNGVRVLSEAIPGLQSVAIGVWVESGSRYERPVENGLSHFIEHLFFKGTARRSAIDIAREIDAVGGVLNADTDREHTCYYTKVLGEHAALAIDLLADIFLESRLDPDEIVREREVVIEEIAQIEDTPDDYIQDLFHAGYWPDHPLGAPVCGTRETVASFDRAVCVDLLGRRYRPNRIVVTAAGNIRHQELVDAIASRFGCLTGGADLVDGPVPVARPGVSIHHRRLEQVQVCVGAGGLSAADPERETLVVLNAALGDSPSSRLFQEIRERRGRAYSIESFLCSYRDTGYIGVGAGTRPRWVPEVVETVLVELRRIRREGLATEELERAKGKLKGALLLGLETSDHRMERLAMHEIYCGRTIPASEIADRIDAVTNARIVGLAECLFVPERCAVVLLGDVRGRGLDSEILAALA